MGAGGKLHPPPEPGLPRGAGPQPAGAAGSVDDALADRVRAGDRRALARAITLVESTRPDHRLRSARLLEAIAPTERGTVRLGVSGIPGVGKSTFIEALGLHVVDRGERVAVLAVDPSSALGGGSILGDKTRMEALSRHPDAFIRSSPTGGTLGGVARRTREAMLVCEAAGFGVVVVETVGVGQSEVAVAGMSDMFLVLLQPGSGDVLQGMKRGIVELADLLVVNKADGELAAAAERTAAEYASALGLLRPRSPHWTPTVTRCSALHRTGIDAVWEQVLRYREVMAAEGELAARRAVQARTWMWEETTENLLSHLRSHPGVLSRLPELEEAVAAGRLAPPVAAAELLRLFMEGTGEEDEP